MNKEKHDNYPQINKSNKKRKACAFIKYFARNQVNVLLRIGNAAKKPSDLERCLYT